MEAKYLGLKVAGIVLEGELDSPAVILKDNTGLLTLPVPVGPFEASAIIMEIEGIQPPRPMTHDLLAELMVRHGFKMDSFLLYGIGKEGYLGKIFYHRRWRKYSMEVRPSDGIALALRVDAAIQVASEVLNASSRCDGALYSCEDSLFFDDINESSLMA